MTAGTTSGGRERFLADAAARGLDVQIVERLAARSLEEAAGILGIQPADIVKSLVVKHKDGSFLFALVPGDRQISWPKLRALLGVNKLSLPAADTAFEATATSAGPSPRSAAPALAGLRRPDHHGPADFHGRRRTWLQRVRGRGRPDGGPRRRRRRHHRTELARPG